MGRGASANADRMERMRARKNLAPALLAAIALLTLPVCAQQAETPAARRLLNSWEIHDEVKPAEGAGAAIPQQFPSFRDYMDMVLFHPTFGYYASGRVKFGPDFRTYPIALAPQFGQMVAEQVFRMWDGMRRAGTLTPQDRFTVAEFGAGDGVLAESFLDYLDSKAGGQAADPKWREFAAQTVYVCYDRSPALSKAQRARNARFGNRFAAREADATDPAATIPPDSLKGVVLSNELPDAFSVHKVILTADGAAEVAFVVPSLPVEKWARLQKMVPAKVAAEVERGHSGARKTLQSLKPERVYLSQASFVALLTALNSSEEYEPMAESLRFQELYLPAAAIPELAGHLRRYASSYARELARVDQGVLTYVNLGAEQFIRGAGQILKAGYVITLDYGANWEGIMGQSVSAHFRTYGPAHREANWNVGMDGDDGQSVGEVDTSNPYQGPTLNDLTSDVNFSLLAAEGDLAALKTMYYGPQSALRSGTAIVLPDYNDWAVYFDTNTYYKLMVQQKLGTDAEYSYPQSTQERLVTEPGSLSEEQRQRATEIEKRLGAREPAKGPATEAATGVVR